MTLPSAKLRLVIAAVSALGMLAAISGTASASIPAVNLEWTQVKVYESPQIVPNTNRTWIGYATRKGISPAYANGTTTPSGLATGPTVDGDSADGPTAAYTWNFPVASVAGGSVDLNTLAGSFQFEGTLTYYSPPPATPPAVGGHGFNIAITNPKLVLNGDGTGSIVASGSGLAANASGGVDYSSYSDLKIFDLDLSQATCTFDYTGKTSLSGIAPSVAAPGFFTPGYIVGSGPDRTPNTFGTFTLVGVPCAGKGDAGAQGPQGVAGPQGPAGKDGKDASVKSFNVRRSPFKTRKSVVAKVTKGKKFVGYAVVTGRKIKLTYISESIRGSYRFNPVPKHYKTVTVRFHKTH